MKHKNYFYIDSDLEVMEDVDLGKIDEVVRARQSVGNYFITERKAKEAQKKVKKLLKNL